MKAGRCIALVVLYILGISHSASAQEQNIFFFRPNHPKWPITSRWSVTLKELPFSWPRNQHEASQIPKQKIVSLVTGAENAAQSDSGYDPDPNGMRQDVESYVFTTFDSGPLYLVATTDDGSTWFQYINVIRCEKRTCYGTEIHSDAVDLEKQLLDLKKDGRHQILVEECLCLIHAHEEGLLPYVLEVSHNEVKDSSARYPDFFKPRLLPIPPDVPNQWNSQDMIDDWRAEAVYAQHDIERRVFGKRDAGLSDALQWEQSKSTVIKSLAISTFEAIDAPQADTGLQRLSQSDSPYMRMKAQDAIARKQLRR
ncbi:MAG TPA: hypothetical protein VIX90_09110 [Edaphobacter sp.]